MKINKIISEGEMLNAEQLAKATGGGTKDSSGNPNVACGYTEDNNNCSVIGCTPINVQCGWDNDASMLSCK